MLQMKIQRINCLEAPLLTGLQSGPSRAARCLLCKPFLILKLTALFQAQPVKLPGSPCMQV